MNFTCLCFDLKYSFKINWCNLLHIYSSAFINVPSWGGLLTLTDSFVDKSPPNSWCDNILCRTTLIDAAPPPALAATTGSHDINLRCCDLGTCTMVAPQLSGHKLQDLIVLGWPGLVPPDAGSETSAQSRRQNWRPETYKGGIHFRWNSVDFVNK